MDRISFFAKSAQEMEKGNWKDVDTFLNNAICQKLITEEEVNLMYERKDIFACPFICRCIIYNGCGFYIEEHNWN